MPISWRSFKNRRNVDLAAWSSHLGISSYKELVEYCTSLGVVPPEENEYNVARPGIPTKPKVSATPDIPAPAKVIVVPTEDPPLTAPPIDPGPAVKWDSTMTKAELFEVAVPNGVVPQGTSKKISKAKLVKAFLAAGHPETKA
jgi:hypothetical protein